MEVLTTIEFWSLAANFGLGIATFVYVSKAKGLNMVLTTIKEAVNKYANDDETKPNKEVVSSINKKLKLKDRI